LIAKVDEVGQRMMAIVRDIPRLFDKLSAKEEEADAAEEPSPRVTAPSSVHTYAIVYVSHVILV